MNYKQAKNRIFKKRPDIEKEYKKKDIVSDISNMIIKARISRELTQKELAEKAGLQQPSIARIESEEHAPNLKTLNKIAEALNYNLEVLLTDDSPSGSLDECTQINYDIKTKTLKMTPVESYDHFKSLEPFTKMIDFGSESSETENDLELEKTKVGQKKK